MEQLRRLYESNIKYHVLALNAAELEKQAFLRVCLMSINLIHVFIKMILLVNLKKPVLWLKITRIERTNFRLKGPTVFNG